MKHLILLRVGTSFNEQADPKPEEAVVIQQLAHTLFFMDPDSALILYGWRSAEPSAYLLRTTLSDLTKKVVPTFQSDNLALAKEEESDLAGLYELLGMVGHRYDNVVLALPDSECEALAAHVCVTLFGHKSLSSVSDGHSGWFLDLIAKKSFDLLPVRSMLRPPVGRKVS